MKNKVEILRSICFTKEDLENITNLADSFSDKEIEFMVEFKKIYEMGLGQLKKFIDKLDKEGKDLDEYSIQYYVTLLKNGPLKKWVEEFSKKKKYFDPIPEGMGKNGNNSFTTRTITNYTNDNYSLGATVDIYNKVPSFVQNSLKGISKQTEEVFRSGLKSSMVHDNTLPIIDKAPQQRYSYEMNGKWSLAPNGNYLVKDRFFKKIIDKISQKIFDSVKEYLGDENFRIWADRKTFFPFDSSKNTSTASNNELKKEFKENDKTVVISLDLLGDPMDSEELRKSSLKINMDGKIVEYPLHTNIGQLSED